MTWKILAIWLTAVTLANQAAAESPVRIVTDIAPVAAIAKAVAGQEAQVQALIPAGADPHDFALKISQARDLEAADQVVWIGPALTPGLEKVIATIAEEGVSLPLMEADAKDPHGWLDPEEPAILDSMGWVLYRLGDIEGALAYLTRAYDRIGARIEEASAATEDPHQAMLEAAAAYARFAIEEPSAFSVLQRLELTRVDTPELWAARERAYFGINAILLRQQATGWAADREIADLIATTWAFVHGFVELWVSGPLAAPYDGQELEPTLRRVFADLIDSMA